MNANPRLLCIFALVCMGCSANKPESSLTMSAASSSEQSIVEPGPTEPPVKPASEGSVQTMFIHEEKADCTGVAPMRCMKVRESESEDWTFFYDGIEGFVHEEGYRYELRVEVTDVDNPPADGSSKRYRLIEVVSKKKAE